MMKPEGIEKFFIKSYDGWDEIDVLFVQFYDCEITDELVDLEVDLQADKLYNVVMDLGKCIVEVLFEGEVVKQIKIAGMNIDVYDADQIVNKGE